MHCDSFVSSSPESWACLSKWVHKIWIGRQNGLKWLMLLNAHSCYARLVWMFFAIRTKNYILFGFVKYMDASYKHHNATQGVRLVPWMHWCILEGETSQTTCVKRCACIIISQFIINVCLQCPQNHRPLIQPWTYNEWTFNTSPPLK